MQPLEQEFIGANSLFINRELSWLEFNLRVLDLAKEKNIPLAERLNFAAIYASNLDEFFMVRVGALYDQHLHKHAARENKTGLSVSQQLSAIMPAVARLQKKSDKITKKLFLKLKDHNLHKINFDKISEKQLGAWKELFLAEVFPLLAPQIVEKREPFPFLRGKGTYLGAFIKKNNSSEPLFGLIPISTQFNQFFMLETDEGKTEFALVEELILHFAELAFKKETVLEKCLFRITRNADITVQDDLPEHEIDYRALMSKLLKKRRKLAAVRLQFSNMAPVQIAKFLQGKLMLPSRHCFVQTAPLNLAFLKNIPQYIKNVPADALFYPLRKPVLPAKGQQLYQLVQKEDVLLFYPYQSVQPFIQMLRDATEDPAVVSIQITLYRVASNSKIVEALIAAAESGKDVVAIVELRARFDEQNNIDWSVRLEQAGCKVVYGFAQYKIHSKLTLITRKMQGEIQYITQIGTGNYNEKTSESYTDISFVTSNSQIGTEVNAVFNNLSLEHLTPSTKRLIVAPLWFKSVLLDEINKEITHQQQGGQGRVVLKCNAVSDKNVIETLSEASCAGVSIDMIVRGICCLRAGMPKRSENIRVRSIIGRYLEHARIYAFGTGERLRIYIASGDFLTRNTERRVEVGVRIDDPAAKAMLWQVLTMQLEDNTNARQMKPSGRYAKIKPEKGAPCRNSQLEMYDILSNESQV